ncbi:BC1872 family protein [Caldibacillus debilis]|uniref:BC1872 family protein n=1 Tax=Caldibacillus debilis TaxID=301148 RepID=UPI0023F0022D|nr:hypothetical protein [Caldibacillus debilis]
MNNHEIDRLVAEKVMGWDLYVSPYGSWYCTGKAYIPNSKFTPTTEIKDAWQVVEKLKIEVIPLAGQPPKNMRYQAKIYNRQLGKCYEAFAETAQLAICLAALKAVGVEVEGDD